MQCLQDVNENSDRLQKLKKSRPGFPKCIVRSLRQRKWYC